MATPTSGSTADADAPSGEAPAESEDGGSVRLEGEVISKRPRLSAALSLLPLPRRNGARPHRDAPGDADVALSDADIVRSDADAPPADADATSADEG